MVTSICFFHDAQQALIEARRILKYSGNLIIGFIDRDSFLGRLYERKRFTSRFYRRAHFYTVNELISILRATGFGYFEYKQTIFDLVDAKYPVLDGFGRGGFVVINTQKRGTKKSVTPVEIYRPKQ
jgi:SAM-dependent methyltransferase